MGLLLGQAQGRRCLRRKALLSAAFACSAGRRRACSCRADCLSAGALLAQVAALSRASRCHASKRADTVC